MKPVERWLQGRTEREVRMIYAAASIVVVLLLVALVWLPLERARTRLGAELPALRASVEVLQRQADEVKRLRALPPSANREAPVAALASAPPAGARVTALDAKRVRLAADDAAFAALLEWMTAAQASHGLHVESARIDALPAAGRVKADIVMARS